jgi:hypothetical protein
MSHSLLSGRPSIVRAILGISCAVSVAAMAAPPGPRPAPGPRAGGPRPPVHGGPRAGVYGPAGRPVTAAKPYHWHASRYYWSPSYLATAPTYVWPVTGYPYYIGGTSYTVVSEPAQGAPVVSAAGDSTGNSDVSYSQLLEFVAMVHEWRTLNESPRVQERLPADPAAVPDSVAAVLAQVKKYNQEFDTVSRTGMQKISSGQTAEAELNRSRAALDSLIRSVEKLPPGSKAKGTRKSTTG